MADEPQLLQRGVRPCASASPCGRPRRRHRHTRPDHRPRQRITPRQAPPPSRSSSTDETSDNVDEPTLLDAGTRASTLTLESATKRATIRLKVLGAALDWLEAGNTPKASAAATVPTSTRRHPHRDGAVVPRSWRTRRPTCGSASLWWRRQMRSGRGPGYERRGVTCMQCGAISVPPTGSVRAAAPCCGGSPGRHPGQAQSQEIPCADCGGATYVDDYCAACGNRRAEPARDQARARRDRADHRPRSRTPPQRGRRRGRNRRLRDRATRSPSPCATGCRAQRPPTPRRRPPRPPESTRCSMRLPLNGNAASAVLAGLADAAKAAAAAGADTPDLASRRRAPTRRWPSFRPPRADRDRRRQRRRQQNLLASRTARTTRDA